MIVGLCFFALYSSFKKGLADACFSGQAVKDNYPKIKYSRIGFVKDTKIYVNINLEKILSKNARKLQVKGGTIHGKFVLYETLSDSIILARLFATIPFEELLDWNREFVMNLARRGDIKVFECQ